MDIKIGNLKLWYNLFYLSLPRPKSNQNWTGSEINKCCREKLMPVLLIKVFWNKSGIFPIEPLWNLGWKWNSR